MNHKRLYVGDLAPGVTEEVLRALFSEIGTVESIQLQQSASGTAQGFAFIEMATPETARDAVKRLNGHELSGFRLIVYTVPPKSRPRESSPS